MFGDGEDVCGFVLGADGFEILVDLLADSLEIAEWGGCIWIYVYAFWKGVEEDLLSDLRWKR